MSEEQRAAEERTKLAKSEQLAAMSDSELLTGLISAKGYIPPAEMQAEVKLRQVRVTKELTVALAEFKT